MMDKAKVLDAMIARGESKEARPAKCACGKDMACAGCSKTVCDCE